MTWNKGPWPAEDIVRTIPILSLPLVSLSMCEVIMLAYQRLWHNTIWEIWYCFNDTLPQFLFTTVSPISPVLHFSSPTLQCTGWRSVRPSQRWSSRQESGRLSSGVSSSFWASLAWWSGGRQSTVNLPLDSFLFQIWQCKWLRTGNLTSHTWCHCLFAVTEPFHSRRFDLSKQKKPSCN